MWSWFRPSRPSARRSHRLSLETLEARDCPAAPVITNLQVTYNAQTSVTISGDVQDENPGSTWVQFSGVVGGVTAPAANGHFTYYLPTSSLGTFGAVAFDQEGFQSVVVNGLIQTAAPVISAFHCDNTIDNIFTITGHVADEQAGGLTVYLTNLPGVGTRTVIVDANGDFSLTLTMTKTPATISAQTADWWGVLSNRAYAEVM